MNKKTIKPKCPICCRPLVYEDDLVEKILNIGESFGVRLGSPEAQDDGLSYEERYEQARTLICKLLQEGK